MTLRKETVIKLKQVNVFFKQRQGFLKHKEHRVLNNLSFEVYKGETLGVMGRNGCGKSTLLKLLAGIIEPDAGHVEKFNNKASLQTLNSGFDNELSGADNALISAMLLGHSKSAAIQHIPGIEQMAELGEKFNEPLKTYSTGMRARLGFAIAITLETDVLLIDEVLGVGDAAFRKKAERIIEQKIKDGMTVILVSHAIHQVKRLCSRAILLDKGEIVCEGSIDKVQKVYESLYPVLG